ncbi:MAG: hypothetical protein CL609_22810 [Anaerolineaceae bacterium]|nr:hypothetical protein [Anaerolineaceae bacterium]
MGNQDSNKSGINALLVALFMAFLGLIALGYVLLSGGQIKLIEIGIGPIKFEPVINSSTANIITVRAPTIVVEKGNKDKSEALDNEDCWETVWDFNPTSLEEINNSLLNPLSSYYKTSFDSTQESLKILTNHQVSNFLADPNSFSWIRNSQVIPVEDATYRVIAWMKTENTMESHISVVAQNTFMQDIYINNTNQMAKAPPFPGNGSYEWIELRSLEFNPKDWNKDSSIMIIGINAGPSFNGGEAITWVGNIKLQKCIEN